MGGHSIRTHAVEATCRLRQDGGALITTLGYRPMFALTAILPALGALVVWKALRERRATGEKALQMEQG